MDRLPLVGRAARRGVGAEILTRTALLGREDVRRLVVARLLDEAPRQLLAFAGALAALTWAVAATSDGPAATAWGVSGATFAVLLVCVVVSYRRSSAAIVRPGHERSLVVDADGLTLLLGGEARSHMPWTAFRGVRRVHGHLVLPLRRSRGMRVFVPAALVDADVERQVRAAVAAAAGTSAPRDATEPTSVPAGDRGRAHTTTISEARAARLATDATAASLLRPVVLVGALVYFASAVLMLLDGNPLGLLLGVLLCAALWVSTRRRVLRALTDAGAWQSVTFDDVGFTTASSMGESRIVPDQLDKVRASRSVVLLKGANGVVMVFPRELFPGAELQRLAEAVDRG